VFLAALLAYIFVVFKAGFVRHDMHVLIGWSSMAAGFSLYAASAPALARSRPARATMLAISVVTVVIAVETNLEYSRISFRALASDNIGAGLRERLQAIEDFVVRGREAKFNSAYQARLERIRQDFPLQGVDGTVDIYPWNAAVVLAHGLDYRPRPVFQSFAAYTAELVELNRRHLRSDHAASTLIFGVGTIDNRFPSLDDGRLLLDIAANYDYAGRQHEHLILRRRKAARNVLVRKGNSVHTTWGAIPVALPQGEGLVVAGVTLRKTLLGRIANVFLKAPPTWLSLTMSDGSERSYTLIPDSARDGFILSPIIDSPAEFEQLVRTGTIQPGCSPRPVAMQLHRPDKASGIPYTWFYDPDILVEFESVVIEHGDEPPVRTIGKDALGPASADSLCKNVAAAAASAIAEYPQNSLSNGGRE